MSRLDSSSAYSYLTIGLTPQRDDLALVQEEDGKRRIRADKDLDGQGASDPVPPT